MSKLAGRRILVAEDEYLIAMELRQEVEKTGAEILGPTASIDETLHLLRTAGSVDAALLDINLGGEMAYPVADALLERGIPIIFISGFGREGISDKYATAPLLDKPVVMQRLHACLDGVLGS
ncbi:response regulator [Dichotomicrobium thermohalophilum]|uniref:CheY-like chemotaxis protein n=1 Tax=Dichotomicrobium thermohalophilum TaxID=933063 RepID=A0A397PDW2_9HYPH|nr:response regulator [Dichotomicrobium thermohalophilum]RIA47690.1 CheY-like chemotaxis protein [Dichotomicrobium thermohalophilum]